MFFLFKFDYTILNKIEKEKVAYFDNHTENTIRELSRVESIKRINVRSKDLLLHQLIFLSS